MSLLSVSFWGPHDGASNNETQLFISSQVFSFPGLISSYVTHMTWFKVGVLSQSYTIQLSPSWGVVPRYAPKVSYLVPGGVPTLP